MESAEDKLIARFFRPLATHPGALGLTDDAAVFSPPEGHEVVLKTDAIVEGVHFLPDDPPDAVARKALRVNLSDLAAKGAQPAGFLLALAISNDKDESWLEGFASGLRVDVAQYGCPLFGGDTDRTPGPVTVAVFAVGTLPRGTMVKRSGARDGDVIVVTGTIGDAALGLKLRRDASLAARWKLADRERDYLLARYRLPQPRLALIDPLRAYASAAMDVSDGLVGDLAKLCRVSGVSAEIKTGKTPLSAGAKAAIAADPVLFETTLTGGDDYEIIATLPLDKLASFHSAANAAGAAVTEIGRVVQGTDEPRFLDPAGQPMTFARPAFSHF